MKPTLLSLFSGIGGIDLAFERAGFQVKGQVELDDYCNAILAKHWPDVPRWRDVRTFGRADFPGSVDVIAGGFPCQDISAAGKGAGIKEGTRSGLWFEFARIIGELRPRYAFLENVPAITSRDGVRVLADLAALGYDAQWGIVAASGVGAPHRRERWFCVAYDAGRERRPGWSAQVGRQESSQAVNGCFGVDLVNAERGGLRGQSWRRAGALTEDRHLQPETQRELTGVGQADADGEPMGRSTVSRSERDNRSVESRLGGIFNGLPARLDTARRQARWPAPPGEPQHEWEAPRTSQGEAHRTARLKALGNSVVPAVIRPFAQGIRDAIEADRLEEAL